MAEINGRFSGVRALIFDLDGTLIDSQLDLVLAVNAALEHMGREPHVHEKICSFIGNGAPTLVRRALGEDVTEADVEKGLAYFLEYYREHMLDNTDVYPGVREALDHGFQFSLLVSGQSRALVGFEQLPRARLRPRKRVQAALGLPAANRVAVDDR